MKCGRPDTSGKRERPANRPRYACTQQLSVANAAELQRLTVGASAQRPFTSQPAPEGELRSTVLLLTTADESRLDHRGL
jgi:hypothetical protein